MPIRATKAQAKAYQLTLDGTAERAKEKQVKVREEVMHQAALFAHRSYLMKKDTKRYACLRWCFATLNGIFLPPHLRAQAIEAGMERGVLDIFVMLPYDDGVTRYSGLAMDLKKLEAGRPSQAQREWAAHLVSAGWLVVFPAGVMDAWWTLASYAGIIGADHVAAELQAQEALIALTCQSLRGLE